ncbi:FAS1 domain-containing protein [Xylariaceae sp. AK1471]|nr:FAS1 domain-containing protein [Xylariaceae sp. AK1471]
MFSRPWATAVFLLSITNLVVSQGSLGLIDALVASGASKFASFIQSDPDVLQLYLSGQIQTVFAPSDSVSDNVTLQERILPPKEARRAGMQGIKGENSLGILSQSVPGSTGETLDKSPLLDGKGQRIVFDTRPANVTGPTKRWHSPLALRQESDTATPSLLRITAGLGNTSNVIKGDIPFDGGLIHITDSYFTLPEALSNTSQATGQTSFSGLLAKSNMTNTLESTHSVTIFLPSNAAFSSSNTSVPTTELLSNHVVAGTVSYLPDLKDGSSLTTQRGEVLAISVRGGQYYVNGARITQANLVLANGVAHVIDKVLTPKPTPVTGGSSTKKLSLASVSGVVASFVLLALA